MRKRTIRTPTERLAFVLVALAACTKKDDAASVPDAAALVSSSMPSAAAPARTATTPENASLPDASFEVMSISPGEAEHVFVPRPDGVVPNAIPATAAVKKHFTIAP